MENVREIVVENLLRLRRKNKMTQQDLADELEYTLRAVQKWMSLGVNDYHVLVRIADVFGIAVEDLIYEK